MKKAFKINSKCLALMGIGDINSFQVINRTRGKKKIKDMKEKSMWAKPKVLV